MLNFLHLSLCELFVIAIILPCIVDLSVPQNVGLQVVDPYTVHMTWGPPVRPYGRIAGYTIEWSRDFVEWENINLPSGNFYDFTDLKPGRTIVASICAHNHPNTSVKFDYVGTRSAVMKVTIPPRIQGQPFLLDLSNLCHDLKLIMVNGIVK